MTHASELSPAIIVHGLEMAAAAVRAGQQAGRPVMLLSAPGAGAYAGVGWWQALMLLAEAADHMLDCGPAPGRALEALRAGQKRVVLRAEPRIWADIAGRARACHAVLYDAPPPALDLGRPGSLRRLAAWLDRPPESRAGDTARTFG